MHSISNIENIVNQSIADLKIEGQPEELYAPIRYIMTIGGKRIRPRLALTTYNLFCDRIDNSIINPALAIEIFHAFTLIHDDIMDKADMRRGMPTVHKKWSDNIAILSGDVMSIFSYKLIASGDSDKLASTLELFSKTATQVCQGQQFDMNYENRPSITMDEYLHMISLKTAVLIACSAKMGALIAGAGEEICDALYRYGFNIGTAFQISDDYLDIYADHSSFGKELGGDIINNKKTWLLVKSFELADKKQRDELEEIFSLPREMAAHKIERTKKIHEELNIKQLTQKEIHSYYNKALESISTIGLNNDQIEQLSQTASIIVNRDY